MRQPRTKKCSDFVARLLNRERKTQLLAVLLSLRFNLLLTGFSSVHVLLAEGLVFPGSEPALTKALAPQWDLVQTVLSG